MHDNRRRESEISTHFTDKNFTGDKIMRECLILMINGGYRSLAT